MNMDDKEREKSGRRLNVLWVWPINILFMDMISYFSALKPLSHKVK